MTKIMLVEDDRSLREIYSIRLVAEGYNIVSAGDGEEGLALAVQEKPDLIIADVMMPKISGFDMLDILRATPETQNIKVIMMTALSSDDQRQRGEALGADRYLVKSQVGIEDVVNTVHELLGDAPNANAAANLDTVAAIPPRPATPGEPIAPATPQTQEQAQPQAPVEQAAPAPEMPAAPAPEAQQFAPQAAPAPMPPMPPVPPMAPEAPAMPAAPAMPTQEVPAAPAAPVAPAAPEAAAVPEMPVMPPAPAQPDFVAEPQQNPAQNLTTDTAAVPQVDAPVAPQDPATIAQFAPEAPAAPEMVAAPQATATPEIPATPAPAAPQDDLVIAPAPAVDTAQIIPNAPQDISAASAPQAVAAPAPVAPEINPQASNQVQFEEAKPAAPAPAPAPAAPAVAQPAGGERVIQPLGNTNFAEAREQMAKEMEQLLSDDQGASQENPFNAPTPPPLDFSAEPESKPEEKAKPAPKDQDTDDTFLSSIEDGPVDFSIPPKEDDDSNSAKKALDDAQVSAFEASQVAEAEKKMGFSSYEDSLDPDSDNEFGENEQVEEVIEPITPGYVNDLTEQLSEDDGNVEAEVVNPLAAQMARELADDPITAEAARLREQSEAEKPAQEGEEGTILDAADDQLPDFLKNSTNLGVNMQNFDQESSEGNSEEGEGNGEGSEGSEDETSES